jgi:hypothetical protein
MTTEKDSEKIKISSRGGVREGAGRPKGSSNKVSGKELLEAAEQIIGKPFVVSLMEGYRDTILDNDRKHREVYEKIIIDKVSSNLFDVEVTDNAEALEAKKAAFAAALASIQQSDTDTK